MDNFKIYKEMAIENVPDGTSALEAERLKKQSGNSKVGNYSYAN